MKKRLSLLASLALAPLLLSACTSGVVDDSDNKAPEQNFLKVSSLFDAPAQVELDQGSALGVFYPKGMAFIANATDTSPVASAEPTSTDTPSAVPYAGTETVGPTVKPQSKYVAKYQQYDGKGEKWSTPLTQADTQKDTERKLLNTSWEGTKYLVATQTYFKDTNTPDSISKGTQSVVVIFDALEPKTGKLVKSSQFEYETNTAIKVVPSTEGIIIVTTKDELRTTLVNPITGQIVDEATGVNPNVIGSSTGKLVTSSNRDGVSTSIPGGEGIKGYTTFNGAILGNRMKEDGDVEPTLLLLDGTTGKQIASADNCQFGSRDALYDLDSPDIAASSSANGRYVKFGKFVVFDKETGKGFCGVESADQKALDLHSVDNDGLILATSKVESTHFKIDISAPKADPIDKDVKDFINWPVFVSEDGIGVFPQQGSAEMSYAIPPKKQPRATKAK